jgi:hypothetical protein
VAENAASNSELIERFYGAPDARFSDPVFRDLRGDEVRAMWRMLCERGRDLELSHSRVRAEGDRGSAHWEADYTFSATGRRVHNEIDADFRFRDGLIAEHKDEFDLWRWSRQALGPVGALLGWAPPLRSRVRGRARQSLDEFMVAGAEREAGASSSG